MPVATTTTPRPDHATIHRAITHINNMLGTHFTTPDQLPPLEWLPFGTVALPMVLQGALAPMFEKVTVVVRVGALRNKGVAVQIEYDWVYRNGGGHNGYVCRFVVTDEGELVWG